ncbi:hypothetical protein HERIO_165 [Hepatospora eriocheir]|uniref:Uncharacterized protein n=1 Tax=Hepatospora eriocheir TaxID=1081669 RepID=A0A1X0QE86_9MICR|nr:hypothetical protein HERIO_165 [Hepatospora eriocheir]
MNNVIRSVPYKKYNDIVWTVEDDIYVLELNRLEIKNNETFIEKNTFIEKTSELEYNEVLQTNQFSNDKIITFENPVVFEITPNKNSFNNLNENNKIPKFADNPFILNDKKE